MNSPRTVRGELTPRDIQVARWIARGKERDAVASILGTSRPAINRHMAKMKYLTGTANATETVAVLMAIGLLTPSDVMDAPVWERERIAETIAPGISTQTAPTAPTVKRIEVAAWLRSQMIADPVDETEEHFNTCVANMSASWEVKIPGQRRDPDAPRPPQQPGKDDR